MVEVAAAAVVEVVAVPAKLVSLSGGQSTVEDPASQVGSGYGVVVHRVLLWYRPASLVGGESIYDRFR